MVIAAIGLASTMPAAGEDRMVLGPAQFEDDKTGHAVLCVWGTYLSVQAETAACALPRRPVDDAIDQAIIEIDEFILTNSSLRPTRPMLDDFKRRTIESEFDFLRQHGGEKTCPSRSLEAFRRLSPDKVKAAVTAILAIPREPVVSPCLWSAPTFAPG
jgi:hypothetical protein